MIGWKANYGYLSSNVSPDGADVSTITWLDVDMPFTFGTIFNDGLATNIYENPKYNCSTSGYESKQYSSTYDAATDMLSILGEDYFTVYLCPKIYTTSQEKRSRYTTEIFPSAYLACPKLIDFVTFGPNKLPSIVYIPSLKRYLFWSSASLNVYKEIGGKLSYLSFIPGSYVAGQPDNHFGYMCVLNFDGTKESLFNQENYRFINFSITQTPQVQFAKYSVSANGNVSDPVSGMRALFEENYVPPEITIPGENPYEEGEVSGPGTLPPGTFDDTSDPIPLPSLPTLSAANTGFTRIYNPTLSQVQALARYLWTDDTVIETIWNHIKQYFEDPMQAIIGFNLVPVPVPDGGTQNFALMYIDTGVSMTVAANQFVDVDCGSVDLTRYYGSALDQSPYTKVHCFLPYIGMVQLNTDEVMGTTLSVNYRVDIVSGSCVASVLVDGNVLYQYSGHCAITIPFSSADFSSYVNAAIQVAKMVAVGTVSGIGAAVESASVGSGEQQTGNTITKTTEIRTTERNPNTGRQITTGTTTTVQTIDRPENGGGTRASYAGLTPTNIANTVGQVISSKPVIQHSGSFSGNSGYLGVRRPYLLIERPRMCLPANYQSLNGYPSMITMSLGECRGFTRVQQIQLTGMHATNPEQAEILELLKMGVVF